jgi:Ca2+-binding RTX toxin-like protein
MRFGERSISHRSGVVVLAAIALLVGAGPAQARPHCHGHRATIVGGRGANHLHGTARPDVIVGGAGRDRIDGRTGFDLICGGSGDDVVLGGPGGDTVYGGSGDDRLYGSLQNDKLVGGSGNDLMIGGEAPNTLLGGTGDDYARDGFNVNGGPGSDWISYGASTNDLHDFALTPGTGLRHPRYRKLENVVGTRFADQIRAGSAGASGTVRGLGSQFDPRAFESTDECLGFAVTRCEGPYAPVGRPIVLVDPVRPDPGVAVIDGPAGDRYSISKTAEGVRVDGPPGVAAGAGCAVLQAGTVSCPIAGPLGYILAMGMEGDDAITINRGFSQTTSGIIDGGSGGDTLRGGSEDDQFDAGFEDYVETHDPNGPPERVVPSPDTLIGGGGNDSLTAGFMGPDRLYGGPGTDQLAAQNACAGGVLDGGPGDSDIANFVYFLGPVRARLGGVAVPRQHYPFEQCSGSIRLARSTEDLEGGGRDDVLIGDGRSNFIAGHAGNDVINGRGGNDNLVGEGGHDRLIGGGGSDHLDCGAEGGRAVRDAQDPHASGCH